VQTVNQLGGQGGPPVSGRTRELFKKMRLGGRGCGQKRLQRRLI